MEKHTVFEKAVDMPCAIARSENPDVNIRLAWQWIRGHDSRDGRGVVLWVPVKQSINNNRLATALASRVSEVATGRRGGHFGRGGPVLALWPDVHDVASITFRGCTALAVVPWSHPLALWAHEVGAHQLGGSTHPDEMLSLDDATLSALDQITCAINHSNTISAGYEKRDTVTRLQRLHDSGHRPDPQSVMEWAAAHGWDGDNVKRLGQYIQDINGGKRPRVL